MVRRELARTCCRTDSAHSAVILRPGHTATADAVISAGPKNLAAAAKWPGRGSVRDAAAAYSTHVTSLGLTTIPSVVVCARN
jgi:hypothetical protein